MYVVRAAIVFILVFSGNYVQKTSAATEGLPPCEQQSNGQYRCQGVFECNHNVTPPVCCPWDTPIFMVKAGKCRKGDFLEPCTLPDHCRSERCDRRLSNCAQSKTFGAECMSQYWCEKKQKLVCLHGKCSCRVGSEWKNKICVSTTKKTLNSPCITSDDCIKERQLKCIKKKCSCDTGFSWIEAVCKANAQQTECDPAVFPNECPHDSKQMECDKKLRVCRCRQDMEYSPSMKACKLKAGENCLINNTLEHDQCLSQKCGNETESTNQTCACPQDNGIPAIWSPDPPGSCVTDYFGFTCTGPNSECRSARFNKTRQGLICKDNNCKCAEGLTYIRGYCVVANLTFGDRCDPDGVRPTCKTDADLTCRDVGGGDFRCVCLQRVMTVRGKRHTVLLTWNGAQKKCDLKSHGERCKEAIECRSGVCQETCVGEQPVPIRRSTGATIYVYDTNVYANYIFLIISFNMILTLY